MHRINQRNMPLSTPPRAGVGVAARPSTSGAPSAAATLESSATSAASFLKLLANEKRLLVLCALVEEAEMSVGVLAERAAFPSRRCRSTCRACAPRDFWRNGATGW